MSCCLSFSKPKLFLSLGDSENLVLEKRKHFSFKDQLRELHTLDYPVSTRIVQASSLKGEDKNKAISAIIAVASQHVLHLDRNFEEAFARLQLSCYMAGVDLEKRYQTKTPLKNHEAKILKSMVEKVAKLGPYAIILWEIYQKRGKHQIKKGDHYGDAFYYIDNHLNRQIVNVKSFTKLDLEIQKIFFCAVVYCSNEFISVHENSYRKWCSAPNLEEKVYERKDSKAEKFDYIRKDSKAEKFDYITPIPSADLESTPEKPKPKMNEPLKSIDFIHPSESPSLPNSID